VAATFAPAHRRDEPGGVAAAAARRACVAATRAAAAAAAARPSVLTPVTLARPPPHCDGRRPSPPPAHARWTWPSRAAAARAPHPWSGVVAAAGDDGSDGGNDGAMHVVLFSEVRSSVTWPEGSPR